MAANADLLIEEITKQQLEITHTEEQIEGTKELLKSLREQLREQAKRLRRIITGEEDMPLFDNQDSDESEAESRKNRTGAAAKYMTDESWRREPIDVLVKHGLTSHAVEVLREEHNFKTMGGLADYSAANDGLSGLDGIGSATAGKIAAACEKFYKARG